MFGSNYNDYRMSLGYEPKSLSEADWHFYKKCAGWEYKFSLLPRRCSLSGKRIWLKKAYRGTAFYRTMDIHIISEHKWHDKDEHIVWVLTK